MARPEQENWKPSEVARLLALVESERRYYQELFSALPCPAAVLDRDLALVAVNREFRRRFKLGSGDISRLRLPDLLPSAALDEAAAQVIEGELPRAEIRVELGLHEPRAYRVGMQRMAGWQDSGEAELLLTVEEAAPAAPPVELPAPVVAWTLDAEAETFVRVSPESGERLGVPAEAWQSLEAWAETRVHPDDREAYLRFHRETLAKTGSGVCEFRLYDAEARIRRVREYVDRGADGRQHGITVDTAGEERQRRRERELAKREALERLAGKLAHVSNNLLMIISGYAEELAESFPEEDARRGDVEEITRAAARLAGLTTQLSAFARPAAAESETFPWRAWSTPGEEPPPPQESGGWVLEGSPALLREIEREAGRILAVYGAPDAAPAFVFREAAEPGFAELRLELPGLPPEAVETLLEPFPAPREGAGPALGLAGPVGRLERAGIAVEVDPAGPALCLRLRARRVEEAEPPPAPLASILLVEDEDGIRSLVEKTLARAGYEVLSAPWAEQALALCQERGRPVDLLITDVVMPGAGGREVASRLREAWPGLKVLFISGHHEDSALEAELASTGAGMVRKPFSLNELLRAVEALLGRGRAASAGQSA